ncbi:MULTISPECIES: hypothetical protein [unclassified Bartonella]
MLIIHSWRVTVLEWLWSVSFACHLLLAILPKNRYESIYADSFIK